MNHSASPENNHWLNDNTTGIAYTFADGIVDYVPPSAKHMETVLHVLDRLKPTKPGNLRAPLHKLAEHFGRRGMLVVISDFYEEPDAILDALGPLRFRGNDLVVFHVLDRAELEFDFEDAYLRVRRLTSLPGSESVVAVTPAAGFITVGQSILVGLVASFVSNAAVHYKSRTGVDDTLFRMPGK